ncbi:hypothetical protein FOZ62_024586 [Perkinsus olseni]|uniref:Uncharacterized protein n=1 Tax=Perkinsus olseni TaxID=32597 RepID=A0A7J6TUC4_PEROL|nr:hypothetical protein FOZ62_024586 [Perkinsus olseni]
MSNHENAPVQPRCNVSGCTAKKELIHLKTCHHLVCVEHRPRDGRCCVCRTSVRSRQDMERVADHSNNGSLTSSRVAPTDWLMIMPTRSITDYVVEAGKFWETQRLNTYWQRMESEERDMARRNQAISKIRARIEEARKELRSLKQELDSSRATNLQLEKRLSTGSADALRDAREFEVDDFDLSIP